MVIVVVVLAAAYCLVAGTVLARMGVRSWRQQAAFGHRMGAIPFTRGFKAGFERGMLTFGVFHYLLGALIAVVGGFSAAGDLGAARRKPSETVAVLLLVLLVGVVVSGWTGIAVIWFNRPRWVVPPHLRDQPGTVSVLCRRAPGERGVQQ